MSDIHEMKTLTVNGQKFFVADEAARDKIEDHKCIIPIAGQALDSLVQDAFGGKSELVVGTYYLTITDCYGLAQVDAPAGTLYLATGIDTIEKQMNFPTNAYLDGKFAYIMSHFGHILHAVVGDDLNDLALSNELVPGDLYLITENATHDDKLTKGKIFKALDKVNFKYEMNLKGDKGDTGEQGIQGEPGADGEDGTQIVPITGDDLDMLATVQGCVEGTLYLITESTADGYFKKGDIWQGDSNGFANCKMNIMGGGSAIESMTGGQIETLFWDKQLVPGTYYLLTNDFDSQFFPNSPAGTLLLATAVDAVEKRAVIASPGDTLHSVTGEALFLKTVDRTLTAGAYYLATDDSFDETISAYTLYRAKSNYELEAVVPLCGELIVPMGGFDLDTLAREGNLEVGTYYLLTSPGVDQYTESAPAGTLFFAKGSQKLERVACFALKEEAIISVTGAALNTYAGDGTLLTGAHYLATSNYDGAEQPYLKITAGTLYKATDYNTLETVMHLGGSSADLGDIENALDSIIAIQNSLIGGESV